MGKKRVKLVKIGSEMVSLFVDFSKAFDPVHSERLNEIILAYGIPEETVSLIMMLYENSKSMARPRRRYRLFWYSSRSTARRYLSILSAHPVLGLRLRTSVDLHKELGFTLTKSCSSRTQWKSLLTLTTLMISLCFQSSSTKLQNSSIF